MSPSYAKAERYYGGDHDLAYASAKFANAFGSLFRTFAMNLCPAICDAVRDKLVVTEFGLENGDETLPDEAWKIWQANRMNVRSSEIHREALKSGDAYAIVWPDKDGKVTIYPNRAATCTVFYDEETPGRIAFAAKHWKTNDKRFRLNLYYPDRVERYISKAKGDTYTTTIQDANQTSSVVTSLLPDGNEFLPLDGDGGRAVIANPYGVVPVFHFANNAEIGGLGISELKDAIPVQDALNKSVLDMLVAMEFAAFRQRWITGIDVEYNDDGTAKSPFVPGADRIWMSESTEAKFGDFESANLEQFLKVKESFRVDMACVTGTPLYYFIQTGGNFPSGESLKKSETRFVNKVRNRQETFGEVWADVMAFALQIENKGNDIRLSVEWEDPSPMSESEELDNLIKKQTIGVTEEQLLMEAGYGAEDIAKMLEAKATAAATFTNNFNAGDPSLVDPNAGPNANSGGN